MNTETADQGDHGRDDETVVSSADLARIPEDPQEAIGTPEVHEHTNRKLEEIRERDRIRAAEAAAAADSESDDDSDDHIVDPDTEWRLDEHTREVGRAGIAEARRRLQGAPSTEDDQA